MVSSRPPKSFGLKKCLIGYSLYFVLATVNLIMYKLKYFTTGKGMCASDLENTQQIENVNLQQVSSLSDMKKFHLPLSGNYAGDYSVVSMQNGDRFYIDKTEHAKISKALNCG